MSSSFARNSTFSSADAYQQEPPLSDAVPTDFSPAWREAGQRASTFSCHDEDADWEMREEVLNARLRAKAADSHSNRFWQYHTHSKSNESASTHTGKRDSVGSSSILHGLRSPNNIGSPVIDQQAEAFGSAATSRLVSRRSLLDPSAFGFDAQNGDPRQIMGKEIEDVGVARPSRGGRDESTVELITIPGLGAEYSPEELHQMRKEGRAKAALRKQCQWCSVWRSGEHGICYGLTPQKLVVIVAVSLVLLGILLFFVIPRMPTFGLQTRNTLVAVPDGASMSTHHSPTNFSMDMKITLRADNTAGWIPTHATDLAITVTDVSTMRNVGTGSMHGVSFPGRKKTIFEFPVHFAYASVNVTGDQTWAHWINACGPKYDNTPRQSLNLRFSLLMRIRGLLGMRGASIQLSGLECPFTLQPEQT